VKRKTQFLSLCCLVTLLIFSGCAKSQKLVAAPTLLPGTDRSMLTAGFWISRHPSPDTLIMTALQIAELNRHIEKDLKTVTDITRISVPYSGRDLAAVMQKDILRLQASPRYLASGRRASGEFFAHFADYMDIAAMPSVVNPGYGVVVRFSDQRILPTVEPLYADPSEVDFDNLQNNTLEMGTPLLLLYRTWDLNWTYVRSPSSSGWVESRNIARCSIEALEAFMHPERFVVILRPKADIYLNPALNYAEEYVQMGVRLPLIETTENAFKVLIPTRDFQGYLVRQQGFVQKKLASEGFLPYTARNVIQQAFEMLNAPYGWGGMYGEQDCSRFVQQVFATVGVNFPRNSLDQAMVGKRIAEFDSNTPENIKIRSLEQASGGITTLYLNGHIMLYLGIEGSEPYAIHETWAYRAPDGDQELTYKINRVAVTDLDLGKGGRSGSLLERLQSVQIIQ
jgi:hypothetical protein